MPNKKESARDTLEGDTVYLKMKLALFAQQALSRSPERVTVQLSSLMLGSPVGVYSSYL